MEDLVTNKGFKPSNWASRQAEVEGDWKHYRSYIMNRIIENEALFTEEMPLCFSCEVETASIKCLDCSCSLLCLTCDKTVHKCNILHDRLMCHDGYFKYMPQEYPFPENKFNPFTCEGCLGSKWTNKPRGVVIVVTPKGRFDIPRRTRMCTNCKREESPKFELANLLHRGFWPGNPQMDKSSYLFDCRVLELWRNVYRHLPSSSLSGFIAALNQTSAKYGRKPTINQTVFSKAAAEYGYMISEMEVLKHQDPLKCPPCSVHQLTAHVDGNHKLYRYMHVPTSDKTAYHANRFVADNNLVEDHLHKVYPDPDKVTTSLKDIYCGKSKWQAARQVSSRYKSMAETGLVVLGCRHALAQKAVNMFRGELYGYSHYLHVTFMMDNEVDYMFQDVICKYWPWAEKIGKTNQDTIPLWKAAYTSMKPALSVLHAKAYSWHCQICWGGRCVDGVGAGSGEDMEQAFSHLSRLGLTTRHMTDTARIDTITDHVLFWNARKIGSLPELLCRRYKRTQESLTSTRNELASICERLNINEVDVKKWTEEVIKVAKDEHFTRKRDRKNILQDYFVAKEKIRQSEALTTFLASTSEGLSSAIGQHDLYQAAKAQLQASSGVQQELDNIKKELSDDVVKKPSLDDEAKKEAVNAVCRKLQTDIELTYNAIRQRSEAITYLADTSKQKSVLRRKNECDKKKIVSTVSKLHQVKMLLDAKTPKLNTEAITEGNFPWQKKGEADWGDKRKVADLYQFQQRLMEEEGHLMNEMKNFLLFYVEVQRSLRTEIKESLEVLSTKYNQESEAANDVLSVTSEESGAANDAFSTTGSEEDSHYKLHTATEIMYTVKGLIAIKLQGLEDAGLQISKGICFFKKATSSDGWKDMVFDASESEADESEAEDVEDSQDTVVL